MADMVWMKQKIKRYGDKIGALPLKPKNNFIKN